MIVLVHHAHALGPDVDPQRPLSSRGLAQAEWLATQAHARGVKPVVIWHSGKLRARQTAEAFYRICNPFADFRMVRGLRPDDSPAWMRDELDLETRDVLAVGHMPHLPDLARALVPSLQSFPLNGLVQIARDQAGKWAEVWRAQPDESVYNRPS
jgi:phosphohistidine phosphatase